MDDIERIREIENLIRKMNRCRTAGQHEETIRHPVPPRCCYRADNSWTEGRDTYGAGWRDFAATAVISTWKETDHAVQLAGISKCTVVT